LRVCGKVAVTFATTDTPQISNGGLPDNGPYNLAQFHFHWGADDTKGSEHTINDKQFPLELHLVHYKRQYGTLANAIQFSDGLAVLGMMFEVSTEANPALAPLISKLSSITSNGATTTDPAAGSTDSTIFYAFSSLLPNDYTHFYRYSGGLTTPTCNEVVTWTVFTETLKVSKAQLAELRTLLDSSGQPIVDNFRPPQPINSRTVYKSFK